MTSPSSSSSSRKRKAPETLDDARLALDEAYEDVKQAKERLTAILHMVKEQQEKKDEAQSIRVKMASKNAKLSVIKKIIDGNLTNLEAAAQKYGDESERLEAAWVEANKKIPEIPWFMWGITFMN